MIKRIFNKRGSSSVFLAMAFVTFAICLAGSVEICRNLAVKSECEVFGHVWTRAILSEYDRHLLEDYSIMAYFGNEAEVKKRIDMYMGYSAGGKLRIALGGSGSDLGGYELGEPENFRKAMQMGFTGSAADTILHGSSRHIRKSIGDADAGGYSGSDGTDEGEESDSSAGSSDRVIGNQVVIDTLPSGGLKSSVSTDSLVERARSSDEDGLKGKFLSAGTETAFIYKYFDSHVTEADDRKSWFNNEWEYIIAGKMSDNDNFEYCRKRIFLMRNAVNLISLYKDPDKVEIIATVAELITPGPAGIATQAVIAEAWAALETEQDMKDLLSGGRAAVIKSPDQWKTGLGGVIDSEEFQKKLDSESRELLGESRDEVRDAAGRSSSGSIITDGLNYDEHLMIMILALNDRVRLLRIMDLVQINMKYRYYRDFNLMEYFIGTRFSVTANGRDYLFEDSYR